MIKSPINYTGNKYKLLKQILDKFPNNIDTFLDLFCGGCTVAINTQSKHKICNDVDSKVVEMFTYLVSTEENKILDDVFNTIQKFNLSRSDLFGFGYYGCSSKTGRRIGVYNDKHYKSLKDFYNNGNSFPHILYTLLSFSFNNQIRFNNFGDFNMPCGKQDFNKAVQNKLHIFKSSRSLINASFTSKDFRKINTDKLGSNDFVYCDPPYLVTVASYNENGGWTEKDEYDLLELLDKLNEQGIKFALSNVLTHKGKSNDILIEWCEKNKDKYIVHHLNHSYSNCNYHDKTGNNGVSDEVLICNYHKCWYCANYGDCNLDSSKCEYAL